ncbi:MAG TPA: spore cortex biosynthesis protein YabQ [Bacillota bacterium]|nr:spore cortex biosynthesis protein YabQ [Bacillota bacterium]
MSPMFLGAVLAGVVLGLAFDVHRTLFWPRSKRRRLTRAGFVLDITFWIVMTPIIFGLLVIANLAQLRNYVYIGVAAGMGGYLRLASPAILRALEWTIERIEHGWSLLAHAIHRSLRRLGIGGCMRGRT